MSHAIASAVMTFAIPSATTTAIKTEKRFEPGTEGHYFGAMLRHRRAKAARKCRGQHRERQHGARGEQQEVAGPGGPVLVRRRRRR